MSPEVLGLDLDEFNRRHGTNFRLTARYAGGEFGAVALVNGHGKRLVLKRGRSQLAADTTRRLSVLGYPAPRYIIVAAGYSVREELPGTPLPAWTRLPERVLDRLLELNDLQADRAVTADRAWSRTFPLTVLEGGRSYMRHEVMREHSEAARRLLDRCREVVERYGAALPPGDDIVHWDFTPSNVLVTEGRVSGVIDWEGTRSGDRHFDLATLLYYTRLEPRLRALLVTRIGEGVLAMYLAHLCFRQTEFSIRMHGAESAARVLQYSLEIAEAFPPA